LERYGLRWFRGEYGACVLGVDTSLAGASMVENFVLANGLFLPPREEVFDIFFSMGLVEHFESRDSRRKLIEEHLRVAKRQGGIVLVEHSNMNFSLSYLWTRLYYNRGIGYKHYRIT
jgi:ubiquinone/menaquinone biosynthesis C-methylase UbiE